ncbi:hypothetical protein FW778_13150 [Ginsengibacter hankyongi]|uniref:Tetratricopeptide repeat protein n=1 Tax=Ginsengibacter hankyongi TaxID=2607284 RepID=A0A5J5IFT9_9BACT|nr:hypothetical protein [Ginsengibacter hankyongi]KAA9038504.1 hypothetical protein FW778_13150 [Ginsengibacter hankyongi]
MNEGISYSEYFYQKGSKETDVLEKNAKEYPSSSLAVFLLLYHYKKIAHPGFEKLAKKTALLFNNQHWLQFQLSNKVSQNITHEIIDRHNSLEKELTNEGKGEMKISPLENFINEPHEIKENYEEPTLIDSLRQQESIANENAETDFSQVSQIEEMASEANETETKIISQDSREEGTQQTDETKDNFNETVTSNTFQQQEPVSNEIAEKEEEIIAFEPLHTVDYFASQGIKITEELLTNDKLGSQMKSFTAWLKSMKKLHPGKLEEQSLATEKLIQTSADESNINTEILTEAMAEVLIKQDKKEKAIEMFSKLSLINPSKSAYFAARIESIKSN